MDAAQLVGWFVWLAIGVGYAWTVRQLARMTRAAVPGNLDQHDSKIRIAVGEADEAPDVSAPEEAYRRA